MMRSIFAVVPLLGCAAAVEPPNNAEMWKTFKADFGKTYGNGEGSVDESRFKVFIANVDKIREHNSKNMSYRLGINQFADLTSEEFVAIYIGGYRPILRRSDLPKLPFPDVAGQVLDDDVDWVTKGGVTPVKNQQHCGSCWAFSTTGAIEGANFAASGQLLSLSEEDLVQCDRVDSGCNGGLMDHAFHWVEKNGICSEEDYDYTSGGGVRGRCRVPACQPALIIAGFTDVPREDEDALRAAVAKQPVSVAIEADKQVFQFYTGGVFDSTKCGTALDHGVLIVGYGTEGGKDYWKVKNSWGPTWGEEGYIRLLRGRNMCGIAMQASYPTGVTAAPPGPAPGPSPPPPPLPGQSHYGDPRDGCMSDEEAVSVQGFEGDFCSPDCIDSDCPTDLPAGVTARPACVLQGPGSHNCALLCTGDQKCGSADCSHQENGVGICTYDEAKVGAGFSIRLPVGIVGREQMDIVV